MNEYCVARLQYLAVTTLLRQSYVIFAVCLSVCLSVCLCLSLSFCLSVCLSVCMYVRITHECIHGRRPNMSTWSRDDPLEVIKFWCWAGSRCGSRIGFRRWAFYTIYCHSPEGDTAAALGGRAFYAICAHSPDGDTADALTEFALFEHKRSCYYHHHHDH